jgi:hypothetical protein
MERALLSRLFPATQNYFFQQKKHTRRSNLHGESFKVTSCDTKLLLSTESSAQEEVTYMLREITFCHGK